MRTALLIWLCFLIATPGSQAAWRAQSSDCPMTAAMQQHDVDEASMSSHDCCDDMAALDIQCNMEMPCGSPSYLAAPVVLVVAPAGPAKPVVERLSWSPPRLNLSSIWRPPNLI
ncbi:hypothetical protein [Permianibacter aggregans]|uniref:hypothetical protein n=1 Tax=Permianibacter aggregans TaxID=1510150 RepID=UPI00105E5ABA|nr:hypothetical protein [Permianibacter aggregans]QGX41639.1 hypothetical protein E2H98_19025 [Permianibacter aggregans]